MGLDFGGGLFPQQGLLQEDGLLSERWGQQGSSLITTAGNANSDHTFYTVTSGVDFYMNALTMSVTAATAGSFAIKDNATTKLSFREGAEGVTVHLQFKVPIKFSTSIVIDEDVACATLLTITGWEE